MDKKHKAKSPRIHCVYNNTNRDRLYNFNVNLTLPLWPVPNREKGDE